MTYALSTGLQAAVFLALTADAGLNALVGTAIFDAPPGGVLPAAYVLLGEEDVRDRSDVSAGGAVHDFTISVYSGADGFTSAKAIAGAVSDALVLSGHAKAVVYVIEADSTHQHAVEKGINRLQQYGAPIAGVVLNKFDVEKADKYGYEYAGYYDQYGYSSSGEK